MRIGRCITAEEIAALNLVYGDDPSFFGCSADVLNILDRKCFRKTECNIRVSHIEDENINPCYPGLTTYLEVKYSCITGTTILYK